MHYSSYNVHSIYNYVHDIYTTLGIISNLQMTYRLYVSTTPFYPRDLGIHGFWVYTRDGGCHGTNLPHTEDDFSTVLCWYVIS